MTKMSGSFEAKYFKKKMRGSSKLLHRAVEKEGSIPVFLSYYVCDSDVEATNMCNYQITVIG